MVGAVKSACKRTLRREICRIKAALAEEFIIDEEEKYLGNTQEYARERSGIDGYGSHRERNRR